MISTQLWKLEFQLASLYALLTLYSAIHGDISNSTLSPSSTLSSGPRDGDVKLVNGLSSLQGTVLVFKGGTWGPICDDDWRLQEASVVCKQLKMGRAITAFHSNKFKSSGLSNFLMDDVRCRDEETSISNCRFRGWGVHDCQEHEVAGVRCSKSAPNQPFRYRWNMLDIDKPRTELEALRHNEFSIRFVRQIINGSGVLIASINGADGPVCPDNFKAIEGNVACKQLGREYVGQFGMVNIDPELFTTTKHVVRVGLCYGNETSLSDCYAYASAEGVPCKSTKTVAIKCTTVLPDIAADEIELERSSYLNRLPLWMLNCAISEGCLPNEVFRLIDNNPHSYSWIYRHLLRFSSIIENVGTATFLPHKESSRWEWHACHMHYHSMKVFATYEVVDANRRIIASGHKASFCLEDNYCVPGVEKQFRCSNTMDSLGTQGITPGCKDMYLHDYDCQWVDVTDLAPGQYRLQVVLNPEFIVPEISFANNAVECALYLTSNQAAVRECKIVHPLDLLFNN